MSARLRLAFLALLSPAALAAPLAAQMDGDGGPELVTAGEDFVLRYPVTHPQGMGWCYGYLYFSRENVRFEVIGPEKYKEHSFEHPKSALKTPHRWAQQSCATFHFSPGRKYHFCHISRRDVEDGKIRTFFPYQDLIDGATKFEQVLAAARAVAGVREERLKPPPAAPPTLSLLEPSDAGEGKT